MEEEEEQPELRQRRGKDERQGEEYLLRAKYLLSSRTHHLAWAKQTARRQ